MSLGINIASVPASTLGVPAALAASFKQTEKKGRSNDKNKCGEIDWTIQRYPLSTSCWRGVKETNLLGPYRF